MQHAQVTLIPGGDHDEVVVYARPSDKATLFTRLIWPAPRKGPNSRRQHRPTHRKIELRGATDLWCRIIVAEFRAPELIIADHETRLIIGAWKISDTRYSVTGKINLHNS